MFGRMPRNGGEAKSCSTGDALATDHTYFKSAAAAISPDPQDAGVERRHQGLGVFFDSRSADWDDLARTLRTSSREPTAPRCGARTPELFYVKLDDNPSADAGVAAPAGHEASDDIPRL
jgi:oligopeptidase B